MSKLHVYVGAYTQDLGWIHGTAQGIALYALDRTTGAMTLVSEIASDNPSFLTLHRSGRFLFAANEVAHPGFPSEGAISAFEIARDGSLTLLNQQDSLGQAPCHVTVEPTGEFVLTANYNGGNFVMYPIGEDGRLGSACDHSAHPGLESDPAGQPTPHAHSLNVAPGGQYALGCDLGLDRIFIYRLDLSQGRLLPHTAAAVSPGSGPRHLAFHPTEKYVYVINELGGTITSFTWDGAAGRLAEIQTVSTLPGGYTGPISCADIHLHPNGRFLYASNRGHDSLAIYRIDPATGRLALLGHESTRGQTPRNFSLTPDGDLLLVANQDSSTVVVFRVDSGSGRLTHLATNEVPTPVCLQFAPI